MKHSFVTIPVAAKVLDNLPPSLALCESGSEYMEASASARMVSAAGCCSAAELVAAWNLRGRSPLAPHRLR
jgi:hypothetical protein